MRESNMAKLTDRSIAALKSKPARYEVWDEGRKGFGVRVTPRGVKSFVWVYHFQGKPRRLTLGTYPALGLADAGVKLADAKKLLDHGEDPGKLAVAERAAERQAETIEQLVADYLERYARPRKRSASEDERILNKDVLSRWRERKVKEITRRDVVKLLNAIVDRGAPIQANRTFTILRRMFRFAVGQAIIDDSPCSLVEAPSAENERERALSEVEIQRLWQTLEAAPMEANIRRILKLILVTAQRKGEVMGMHEREIDRDKAVWIIPAERSKNGREHVVPLPPLALQLLDAARPDQAGWIFPSGRTGAPYRGQSIDHAVRDLFVPRPRGKTKKATATLPTPLLRGVMEAFTPHDLRRTAATRMREFGVSRADVKDILNHKIRDVTDRYDRYDGLPEKRRALERWARHLELIISGEQQISNVVELARA
jgi:integrase